MNAAELPSLPVGLAIPTPKAKDKIEPPVRLGRLLWGLAFAVALFDLCFWGIQAAGLSVTVFFVVLSVIILGNRELGPARKSTRLILALLAGAAVAGVIETGVTNITILIVLIVGLAGNTFFTGADSLFGRWFSQGFALIFAPGRVFWLGARVMEAAFGKGLGWTGGVIGGVLLAIPAIVLALVFGSLLASGNAIFGNWTNSFFDWFWNELVQYLDAGRISLWLVVALVILPLLRPTMVSEWLWRWTERLPRLPEIIPNRGAVFSSGLVLLVLNLLFFIANIADALFLWSGRSVPVGVTYSEYVHSGVNTLLITVILSALVLTTIFQQPLGVARSRVLKTLSIVWISQNLFLLLSVSLRLKLYIEAYGMTVTRLSLMIFLVLVAMGFCLLTVKIMKDRSLSWLIGGCVLAVFLTLYITQFLDLKGWSANYNVAMWEKERTRNLDLVYLRDLGPAGWPALRRAVDEGAHWDEPDSAMDLTWADETNHPKARLDLKHWREFSLRASWNRWALEEKPNN